MYFGQADRRADRQSENFIYPKTSFAGVIIEIYYINNYHIGIPYPFKTQLFIILQNFKIP